MSDSVKFIFKTLIKVPIIIAVAYGIFNIFAFCFIYFKMLGLSYVVMQTAVENNYLPEQELNTLQDYIEQIDNDIYMVENAGIVVGVDGDTIYSTNMEPAVLDGIPYDIDARRKRQYGRTVTVGITCDYVFIWPLDYRTNASGQVERSEGFYGNTGTVDTGFSDEAINDAISNNTAIETNNNMSIVYTVPGLKYYPDLAY